MILINFTHCFCDTHAVLEIPKSTTEWQDESYIVIGNGNNAVTFKVVPDPHEKQHVENFSVITVAGIAVSACFLGLILLAVMLATIVLVAR